MAVVADKDGIIDDPSELPGVPEDVGSYRGKVILREARAKVKPAKVTL